MGNNDEKERRNQMRNELRKKANEEFENSLPMSRENFKKLFDHLNTELENKGCDHTTTLTQTFLPNLGINNPDSILEWLADKGGYCDCEILANVEEQFDGHNL